jgi:CDP-diacylglycerol--serine O-phosphatidyltransferase
MNRIWVPTLISVGNIICGFVAIIHQFQGNLEKTMWWTVAAVFFDAIDGVAASRLNAKSEMGTLLDALSDIVSFALLPGFVLYQFFHTLPSPSSFTETAAWVAGIGYAVAGVFREVRFLSIPPEKQSRRGFTGLPIAPPASLIIALITLNYLLPDLFPLSGFAFLIFGIAALSAYLMTLSNVEYLRWRGRGMGLQALGAVGFGIWGGLATGTFHGVGAAFFAVFSAIYYFGHLFYRAYQIVFKR